MPTAIASTTTSERDREKKYYYCFGPSKKTRKNGATDSSGDQEERFSRIPVANLDQKIETSLVRNKTKLKFRFGQRGYECFFFGVGPLYAKKNCYCDGEAKLVSLVKKHRQRSHQATIPLTEGELVAIDFLGKN